MKILFVGMVQSVHFQRWVTQLADTDWDLHVFASIDMEKVHPEFRNVTVHHTFYAKQSNLHLSVSNRGIRIGLPFVRHRFEKVFRFIARELTVIYRLIRPDYRERSLQRVIQRIKPDIIHSIEFQHGGYLTLEVKRRMGKRFPTWVATNYGSDVQLFGRLAAHRNQVRAILEQCDYYDCECERDIRIAQEMGLKGKTLPLLPNAGGFDFARIAHIPRVDPPSSRRQIILKGYQHFAGRALAALQAFARCTTELRDYRIAIYSAFPPVAIAAELLAQDTGLTVDILPDIPHDEMLAEYGKSRAYIGLSISDAISTSLLEAMVMGALPIQSGTACTDEWIEDGVSGLVVPPDDVDAIETALRRALADDTLVDEAASINQTTCRDRLDHADVREKAITMYEDIYRETSQ